MQFPVTYPLKAKSGNPFFLSSKRSDLPVRVCHTYQLVIANIFGIPTILEKAELRNHKTAGY